MEESVTAKFVHVQMKSIEKEPTFSIRRRRKLQFFLISKEHAKEYAPKKNWTIWAE